MEQTNRIKELESINAKLMEVIRKAVIYLELQATDEQELLHTLNYHEPDDCILCELKALYNNKEK